MSNIFDDSIIQEDELGFSTFAKPCFSPSKKNLQFEVEGQLNFSPSLDFQTNQLFSGHNDLNWQNALPSNLSRGNSNFDFPVQKKQKTDNFGLNKPNYLLQEQFLPSTTQSDTSNCVNSSSSKSFLESSGTIKSSYSSRNEESSINSTLQNEQSHNSESQNITSQLELSNLTKTNKRQRKQETKQQIKKKEQEKEKEKAQKQKASKKNQKKKQSNNSSYDSEKETTYDQMQRLTNKKREYLQEVINDRNGVFNYEEDPEEYKRARKRMQNRESAVRSRLRKRYYQDELEDKISELEKMYKEMSEQNAGLAAQNSLLKKQLTYFEDVFAKSSLLGYDPMNTNISRNDLEAFQRNLLKKINSRLYHERELEIIPEDHLEIVPGSSNHNLEEIDGISTTSLSNENQIGSLRLARSRSNSSSFSGSGYLFLAIVFCMMCCSSFLSYPSSALKLVTQSQGLSRLIPLSEGRKLMSKENSEHLSQQTLAAPLDDDHLMEEENSPKEEKDSQIGAIQIINQMVSGQYTYITYMILSATCFFFWMTPNYNKIRHMFKFSSKNSEVLNKKIQAQYQRKIMKEQIIKTRSQKLKAQQN